MQTRKYKWLIQIVASILVGVTTAPAWGQVTVVSQASGNWEETDTWTGGLPHGNNVFIQAGHTVTMNGLATRTINSLSITGLLEHAVGTAHAVNLHIANDLTIAEGGSINVNFKGDSASGYSGNGPARATAGWAGHREGASAARPMAR